MTRLVRIARDVAALARRALHATFAAGLALVGARLAIVALADVSRAPGITGAANRKKRGDDDDDNDEDELHTSTIADRRAFSDVRSTSAETPGRSRQLHIPHGIPVVKLQVGVVREQSLIDVHTIKYGTPSSPPSSCGDDSGPLL